MKHSSDTPLGDARETSALELIAFSGLTLAIIALSQIVAQGRTAPADGELFAYFGWLITQGGVLYVDMWDNTPPGIFWINALGLRVAGGDLLGVALITLAAVLTAHVLFFRVACGFVSHGAAAIGTCLASLYLCHASYDGASNRTETYVVLFELAAIAMYVHAFARPRGWNWFLVGAFCGGAFVFKQLALAAFGATIVHQLVLALARISTWRVSGERIATIATGVLVIATAMWLALVARGSLSDAGYAIYGFNRAHLAASLSRLSLHFTYDLPLELYALPILTLPLLLALAALIHATLAWRFPRLRAARMHRCAIRPADCPLPQLLFAGWLLIATCGAMLGPRGIRAEWLPALPPLLLLGVYTIGLVKGEARLLPRVVLRRSALVAMLAIACLSAPAAARQWDAIARVWIDRAPVWTDSWRPTVRPSELEVVAGHIRRLTEPTDRIVVWSNYPGVYLHARRSPICRFPTMEKTWQVGNENAKLILDEAGKAIVRNPPKAFVFDADDYQILTATGDVPYRNRIEPWIARLIAGRYDLAARTDQFYVLLRRDPTTSRP